MNKRIIMSVLLIFGTAAASWAQLTDLPVRESESLWASSVLVENLGGRRVEYGPEALFDGDVSTCWVEGVEGPGRGENILMLCQRPVEGLRISNGFASDTGLYRANNRIRSLRIGIVAGLTAPGMISETDAVLYKVIETEAGSSVTVADTSVEQYVDFPVSADRQAELMRDAVEAFRSEEPFLFSMICRDLGIDPDAVDPDRDVSDIITAYGFYAVRLTIEEVYPGTRYDDTCLAEVSVDFSTF